MIRYIAELAQGIDFPPELFTGASPAADNEGRIISKIDSGIPIGIEAAEGAGPVAEYHLNDDAADSSGNENDGTLVNFGPVAEYHFDGDVTDSSGNGNNGTANNITYVAGVKNQAADFNGTDSFVTLPSAVYTQVDANKSFSIAFRLYLDTLSQPNSVPRILEVEGTGAYVRVYYDTSSARLQFRINDGTENTYISTTSSYLSAATWYHVVCRYNHNTGEQELIIDESVIGSAVRTSFNAISPTEGIIGAAASTGFDSLDGKLDDYRILDYYISDAEIAALYDRPQKPAHWVDGVSGKALSFSGRGEYVDLPNGIAGNISSAKDFSFGCHVNLNDLDTGDHQSFVCFYDSVTGSIVDIMYANTSQFRFRIYDGTSNYSAVGPIPTQNTTYFVEVVYRSATKEMSIYVGGYLYDTALYTGGDFNCGGARIGRRVHSNDYTHGWIDETFIFSRALTADEIKFINAHPGVYLGASYWSVWDGTYDNPATTQLQIFLGLFLIQVGSLAALFATDNSFYVSGTAVYTNTTRYPWQYADTDSELLELEGYASAVSDPARPSEIRYSVNGALVPYPVRLSIPAATMNNKLSGIISGVVLYDSFTIEIDNGDGRFDKASDTNYFNIAIRVKKSSIDTPTLSDFTVIRAGLGDNVSSDSDKMRVTVADINRTFDEEVCRTFTVAEFPDLPDNNVDKNIPVAWGPHYGAELHEVGDNKWLAVDPDYYVSIDAVYDKDGVALEYTVDSDGIITVTTLDGGDPVEPKTCDFTGSASCKIGEIITSEIAAKSNIAYTSSDWDTSETDYYIAASARISLYFDAGDVKRLIKECLQNDNAFLINKNDGRLSLRQWGKNYYSHTIPSWMLTKQPKRTHIEQKYYASSIMVRYDYHIDTKKYAGAYLDDTSEAQIAERWRKRKRQAFETALRYRADASYLATRLLDRFRSRREVYTIYTGYDCSEINPLDKVALDITVNGREYSTVTDWIVREVNPAQDILVLEEESTSPQL